MRRAFLILTLLLLLPVALLGALLTPWGLGLAAGFVPGLKVEGISSGLPSRLGVQRFSLSDTEGPWLEVEGAELRLAWRELWERRLRLESFTAQRIALHRLPPSAPAEPAPLALPQLPHLPLALAVDRLALARIELGAPVLGQAAAVSLEGAVGLEAARLSASLALQRLDQAGSARLELALDGAHLTARLNSAEPSGGLLGTLAGVAEAPFALDLSLDGPASGAAWRLDATLGAAEARFTGNARLSPEGAVALDLTGSASPAGLIPAPFAPLAAQITLAAALARAPDGALSLQNLALSLPAGRLTAQGRLGAAEALEARFRLEAAAPALFAPWLPPDLGWRALSAEGQLTGSLAAPILDATLTAEIDLSGDGKWVTYQSFPVKAGTPLKHDFPNGFSAYWIRFKSDKEATVGAHLEYR